MFIDFDVIKHLLNNFELEISFYVHSTEDDEKILHAIEENFCLNKSLFNIIQLKGHHGNPIIKYHSNLKEDIAQRIFEIIFKRLEPNQKQTLLETLDEYIDSSKSLYVRLDKPKLCEREISLGKANSIHFKFKPKKIYLRDAVEFYRESISNLRKTFKS